jgi:hypothetical protein
MDDVADIPPISDEDLAAIELTDADRADLNSKNLKSKKIEYLAALAINRKRSWFTPPRFGFRSFEARGQAWRHFR